ncbi:Pentatricopeptide repeat-containing protein [Raphanus sativus]|nr:Pentatricopeptide repeat-containing protein [Raphanus sativus]
MLDPSHSNIWKTVLASCRVYNKIDLGKIAAVKINGMKPTYSAACVLLSDMYADCRVRKLAGDLTTRLMDIGYELDTSYVLQDIVDDHNKAILSHHSERLAIDFGLIAKRKGLWRLSCCFQIDCKD